MRVWAERTFSNLNEIAFLAFGLFKDKNDIPGFGCSRYASASPAFVPIAVEVVVVWMNLRPTITVGVAVTLPRDDVTREVRVGASCIETMFRRKDIVVIVAILGVSYDCI